MPAFDAAFDPPDSDPDDDGGNEPSSSSRDILEDLRAIGAISAEEARRHREPAPPERQIRWEMRLRQPGQPGRAGFGASDGSAGAAYDSEARFRKDVAYGRNREGPDPAGAAPRPERPRADGTPGVSFEERPMTRPVERPAPELRPARQEAPLVRPPARPLMAPPRTDRYAPTPARVHGPGAPQRGVPEYPYGASAPTSALPVTASLDERIAEEAAHHRAGARAAFVRDFRSVNPSASEGDAENAWEARLRASTMEL